MGGSTSFTPLAEGEVSNSNYGTEYIDVIYETDADGEITIADISLIMSASVSSEDVKFHRQDN